jgi:hypothetical protein
MSTKKEALAKQLIELDKYLESKKLKWNLGIFAGYTIGIFILFLFGVESIFDNILHVLVLLLASAFLGGICYWINALVWITCCNSINETTKYKNKLEKEWDELNKQEELNATTYDTSRQNDHPIPEKYLNRGYNEFQIEYIREALYEYQLTKNDIDYFLSLKDEPKLLMEYHFQLQYEIETYLEEEARERATKEVFKAHNINL